MLELQQLQLQLFAYSQMTLSTVTDLDVDDTIMSAQNDGSGVAVSKVVSISGNVVSHVPVANSAGGYRLYYK